MRRFTTTVLAGLLLLGVPALGQAASARDAGASGGWTDPKPLGRNGVDVDIATNRGGDMVAVWSTSTGVIRARYRPAGEPWGEVEQVTRGDWAHLYDGSVLLDARGRATVLWEDSAGLRISDRRHDGTWRRDRTAPLVHEDAEGCGDEWVDGNPVLAADGVGNLFVSWAELGCDEGYSAFEHYTWRLADGTWTRLRDGGGASGYDIVFPRTGRAVVISSGGPGLRIQSLRAGEPLGPGRILVPYGDYHEVDVEANARRDLAVLANSPYGPHPGYVLTMTKRAGESWSVPHHTPVAARVEDPVLGLANDGTAVVAYLSSERRTAMIAVTTVAGMVGHTRGNRWESPTDISRGTRADVPSVDVAVSRAGDAAVVWARSDGPSTLSSHAATRPAGGSWTGPVRLAGKGRSAWPTPNVVRSRGRFTAAFTRNAALFAKYRTR